MSSAFKYTNKVIPVVMMVVICSLMQFYFNEQNIYDFNETNDAGRVILIICIYGLLVSWLLLFFVFEDSKMSHGIVAFLVLVFTTTSSFVIYKLYSTDYEDSGLETIKTCAYLTLVTTALICVFVTLANYSKLPYMYSIFCALELVNILGFFVFLVVCSTLPPLFKPSQLTCTIK